MLPPQLRQGLVLAQRQSLATLALKATPTHLLRAGLSHSQHRSFFGWRRRSDDYSSHLDPMYHRFCRFRTLKTRAKLLKNLRRRGKFNWDFDSKPFFTPQLVRWASHWDGKHRQRWYLEEEAKKTNEAEEEAKKAGEEDGFELSPREKEWKEKMEAMRKRIEKDPYEAIFGKRFEPFWSPLVPSWMREEMGLQGWPKMKEKDAEKSSKVEAEPTKTVKNETGKAKESETAKTMQSETADKTKSKAAESTKMETATANPQIKPEQRSTHPQPSSYSYASSTSWDSWTNKTKRVEWDSVSGQTRKYEYDPISNRMIQVEASKSAAPAEKKSIGTTVEPTKVTSLASLQKEIQTPTPPLTKSTSVNIPVKQSSDLRKSIPIPPPLSQSSLGWSKMAVAAGTSIGPLRSTALASDVPKPAALTKLPEKEVEKKEQKDIDSLTADDVRASMGKSKVTPAATSSTSEAPKTLITAPDAKFESSAKDTTKISTEGRTRSEPKKSTEWDKAEMSVFLSKELDTLQKKKEKLVKDERGLFHIERQKRELQKLDERIQEVTARVERLAKVNSTIERIKQMARERKEGSKATIVLNGEELGRDGEPISKVVKAKAEASTLQSSVERMQSKELPKVVELDDSAAHESTEALSAINAVPKNWAQQAELLQADRVRRTAARNPLPTNSGTKSQSPSQPSTRPMNRWIDDMRARQSAIEAKKASEAAAAASNSSRAAKLEKANAMLEAEVKETKFKMQAHENRYAHKIRALRGELETAYKQSTVHSEKHLERIRFLEEELGRVTRAADGARVAANDADRIKKVEEANKRELEKLEKKLKDRELVKEVRQIYEKAYGTIDALHRQSPLPFADVEEMGGGGKKSAEVVAEGVVERKRKAKQKQVVEVESDVDLGEALERYEKEVPSAYAFAPASKDRELENEIARDERAYWESDQGPLFEKAKEPSFKLPSIPDPLAKDEAAEEAKKLVDDKMPKLIPTELTKPAEDAAETTATSGSTNGIAWHQPPIYKVLAYDSGNDMMSTATTTSNFTTSESPISIPQALSQLYNPARFVPYFAELQKDGYQVIFGTTDLLVFKKVKGEKAATEGGLGLEDHGLYPPFESRSQLEKVVAEELGKERGAVGVNPVDGTAMATPKSEAATGNFASPTGFVNHDLVLPTEQSTSRSFPPESQETEPFEEQEDDIEYRHYPRVRRMEQHFTGSRRRWNSNHRRHKRAEERGQRGFNRSGRKSTLRWIVGVGAGTAAVMYMVGTVAQRSRVSREEDWARRAEEERRRWRS